MNLYCKPLHKEQYVSVQTCTALLSIERASINFTFYLSRLKVVAYFLERKLQQKFILLDQMETVYDYLPGLFLPAPLFIWPLSISALFQMSFCLLYKAREELRQISGPERHWLYHRLFNPKPPLGWKYTRLFWISYFLGHFVRIVQ